MNRQNRDRRSSELRRAEAVRWFTLLREGDPSIAQLQQWDEWIGVADNRSAYETVTRVWQHAGILTGVRRLERPARGSIGLFIERMRASVKIVTLSASTAVSTIAALWFFAQWLPSRSGQLEVYETAIAQHREVVLSDGSQLHLGAGTAVSVRYAANRRTVVLDRGEALFNVAGNPERPFSVLAGLGSVTAVGTAFVVHRDDDRTVVRVTEGTVKVARRHAGRTPARAASAGDQVNASRSSRSAALLVRGEQVSYGPGGDLGRVERFDPVTATAWMGGQVRYRNERLRYVIADLNRYSHRQIVLSDRQSEELRFTGTVRHDRIEEWLRALVSVLPVEIERSEAGHITVRHRSPAPDRELQSSR